MSLKHYLFLGDSITDAGHLWEADPRMLGDGFIRKISESTAFSSAHLVNRGQDGFTSAALLRLVRRMTDLDTFTTITVLIGVNDLPVAFYTDPTWIRTTFAPSVQALFELLTSAGSKKLLMHGTFFVYSARTATAICCHCSYRNSGSASGIRCGLRRCLYPSARGVTGSHRPPGHSRCHNRRHPSDARR